MPQLIKVRRISPVAVLALLLTLSMTLPVDARPLEMPDSFQRSFPGSQRGIDASEDEDESADETAAEETEAIDETDGPIAELADVRKAVVQIEAVGTFVDPQEGFMANAAGRGSGFIIDETGIAVTNNHVVTGGALFRVYVEGEDEPLNARVLGVSECADLAVIDIQGDGYPYLDWYEDPIRVGLDVYAVGFPLGDPEFTMTRGIVAKEEADGESYWASVDHVLQHDADINPGNSGGPLVDKNGSVVGINYRLNQANQYFAISRDEALPLIEALRRGEDVDSIGINSEAVSYGEELTGIWASSVESGSPAETAGLLPGDIILSMEGLDLATDGTMATYCEILRSHDAADVLSMTVLRLDTDEVLEGQLNGRTLERSFSLVDSLEEEQAETGAEPLDDAAGYEEYTTITDEQGIIAVEVPAEWSDVMERPWMDGDETEIGIELWASTDIEAFSNNWGYPGLIFYYSDQLAADIGVEDLLDTVDYAEGCTYDDRYELPEGFFRGNYDVWTECGESGSEALILALEPETDDYLLRIELYSVTQADLDAMDRILDSFLITPLSQQEAEEEEDDYAFETVDDVDTSGLIYDYVLFEDAALSALLPDEWTDTKSDDWYLDDELDDQPYGRQVHLSSDLDTYYEQWTLPGMEVYMTEQDAADFDPYDALENIDFSEICTYDERVEHQHTIYGITYDGAFDVWRDCAGEENAMVVLSATSTPADHAVILYFLAVDDADYEAFNVLQRSFFVYTVGMEPVIEETIEQVNRQSGDDAYEYTTQVDEEGAFAMAVPISWSDFSNDDWVIDGEVVGRSLEASPDLVDFADRWDMPGVFVGVSPAFAEIYTPDELLDALDFNDECLYDERFEYDDSIMVGAYDIWTNCADVDGQAFVVLATNPIDDDGEIVLYYANMLTDADVDAFEQMLSSLTLGDANGEMASSTIDVQATVTILASTLNVRSGPGTNFSRIDAVNGDEELRIAGQNGNCAWLQIVTEDGQPGWVSGSSRYVSLNGDCASIPEVAAPSGGSSSSRTAGGQGCYTFQNELSAELNVTFTNSDSGWNATFKVAPKGESRQCFDPGPYTYTLDAPPPWGSSNGETTISSGDEIFFPITGG